MEKIRRRYPKVPLVGVAGIVVENQQFLLIKRGKAPGRGEWNLPGGLVEVGEQLTEAVRREIREETGLEVRVETLLVVADRIIRDRRGRILYHFVLHDYLCRRVKGEPAAASDAAEVRWVAFEEVPALRVPDAVRGVLEKARKWMEGDA